MTLLTIQLRLISYFCNVLAYESMKKILILSYFFNPCSLTASNRVTGFAKHLNSFGIFPIIITRNWDLAINTPEDVLKSTGNKVLHKVYETHEVYYLPYTSSLRDRIFLSSKNSIFKKYTSKFLTILTMIFELVSNRFIPYSNFYDFTLDYLQKNKDLKAILTSANPFIQFKFCYLLHKKTGIPWIADYRDAWTTNKMAVQVRGINKALYFLQSKFEKKWCSTAAFFTTVSDNYVEQISDFLKIPGHTILNGYDDTVSCSEFSDSKDFHIVHNGTLYYNQPIEEILNLIIENNKKENKLKIHIHFPGLGFDPKQTLRVSQVMEGYEKYLHITNWLPKNEVLELQKNADLLLMLSYTGFKGIPSSKLYEYIGLQKNILHYPNDKDVIEQILNDTKLGINCDSIQEVKEKLEALILCKLNKSSFKKMNEDRILFYSRKKQTEILASKINSII
jgi:glycosyltransferase involved in cell wall biosynthesis